MRNSSTLSKIIDCSIMKQKKGWFVGAFLLVSLLGFSQDNGLGVRLMSLPEVVGVGASFKHMIAGKMSYEATVGSDVRAEFAFVKADFNFFQRPIAIQGLDWYTGAGVQSWFSTTSFEIAPELTLGLDWDMVSLPLGFFIDGSFYAPVVNDVKAEWQLGAGVRFLFE